MLMELQVKEFSGREKEEFIKYFQLDEKFLDYQKFADTLGYVKPLKSNKEENRRIFFKLFLKDLLSIQTLEQELVQQDINVQNYLNKSQFKNVLEGLSRGLMN
jgi:hypothetical protein